MAGGWGKAPAVQRREAGAEIGLTERGDGGMGGGEPHAEGRRAGHGWQTAQVLAH